jgi:hypothetical protein
VTAGVTWTARAADAAAGRPLDRDVSFLPLDKLLRDLDPPPICHLGLEDALGDAPLGDAPLKQQRPRSARWQRRAR